MYRLEVLEETEVSKDKEEEVLEDDGEVDILSQPEDTVPLILINAFTGTPAYQTIRISGKVKKQKIRIW